MLLPFLSLTVPLSPINRSIPLSPPCFTPLLILPLPSFTISPFLLIYSPVPTLLPCSNISPTLLIYSPVPTLHTPSITPFRCFYTLSPLILPFSVFTSSLSSLIYPLFIFNSLSLFYSLSPPLLPPGSFPSLLPSPLYSPPSYSRLLFFILFC